MCTQNDAIKIMHHVISLCNDIFPVKEAYLYGSYVRGDFHPESDMLEEEKKILSHVRLEKASEFVKTIEDYLSSLYR